DGFQLEKLFQPSLVQCCVTEDAKRDQVQLGIFPGVEAIETAALMLGSDRSRGYCLEMSCADFLAGANLDNGDPETLLFSITRFFKFLPGEQRKVGNLLAAADARAKERARLLNEQRIAEAAKRRAEDEAIRTRYLDQLGRRQPEIWKRLATHIQMRQPKDYDKAVSLLTDLHDLAVRRGQTLGCQTELDWRRSGKYTPPRRASCADLPRQTCKW
ncbi:MAG: hypothetical protein WBW98_16385, partial [Candidatus Sulfotelmatobacter sp.]